MRDLQRLAPQVLAGVLPRLYPQMLEIAYEHQDAGRPIFICTAASQEMAELMAVVLTFDGAIGSVSEVRDGKYTGREGGPFTYREGKAQAIRELAEREDIDLSESYAYTDSESDLPMLRLVGHPVAVNPDAELRAIARAEGWQILTLRPSAPPAEGGGGGSAPRLRWAGRRPTPASDELRQARRHRPRATSPTTPRPLRAALAEGAVTATDAFYVRGHGPVPDLDPATFRLRVTGLVERELTLSLDDLRSGLLEIHEEVATLQCAGNRRAGLVAVRDIPGEAPWGPGATGTATWRGVRLADVLAAAGVKAEAAHVGMEGADDSPEAKPPQRFGGSIPLDKARRPEVLLAFDMNGEPLTPVHGAPLRSVVPGYIGARSVKWLDRIELRADPWDGYFQDVVYRMLPPDAEPAPGNGFPLGIVALNSDVLAPADGARVPAGAGRAARLCLRGRRARSHARRRGGGPRGPCGRPSCSRTWAAGPGASGG